MRPFRFWCQKVLPLVYDDSLSYYELLNKLVYYVNSLNGDVSKLADIVNNFNINAEVSDKLDQMAQDGTLDNLYWPTGIINVKKHGAVGDGITDDTEAINSAISILNEKGGVLYFPQGTYKISDTLRILHNCSAVRGDTQQGSYIKQVGNCTALHFGRSDTVLSSFRVEDIGLIYGGNETPSANTYGIKFDHGVNCTINNTVIGGFYTGIMFDHTGNSFITECGIVSSVRNANGIYMGNHSVSCCISNCYVGFNGEAANTGIGLYNGDGNIADLQVNYLDVGNGYAGVLIDGQNSPADYPPADITLCNIVADASRFAGILVRNINSRGNVNIRNGWLNPLPNGTAICVDIINSNNVSISGTTMQQLSIDNPSVFGVNADNSKDVRIVNNTFVNIYAPIGVKNSDRITANSNTIKLASGVESLSNGLTLENCNYSIINGNNLAGNYNHGILITSGNHSVVTSNIITETSTAYSNNQTDAISDNNIFE